MWSLLDKLRQKPDHEKQRIAFLVSITVTLLIAVVWLSTFKIDSEAVTANTSSPIESFSNQFNELWNSRPNFNLEEDMPEELQKFPETFEQNSQNSVE